MTREFVMMPEFDRQWKNMGLGDNELRQLPGEHKMSVYESIMQGLTEAVDYQQGKIRARKIRLTIKPVDTFNNDDIKQIRQKTGLSQLLFAGSLGVSPKTVEAWENGRNKPEGASRRLLEIVRDDPGFLKRFQAEV